MCVCVRETCVLLTRADLFIIAHLCGEFRSECVVCVGLVFVLFSNAMTTKPLSPTKKKKRDRQNRHNETTYYLPVFPVHEYEWWCYHVSPFNLAFAI